MIRDPWDELARRNRIRYRRRTGLGRLLLVVGYIAVLAAGLVWAVR